MLIDCRKCEMYQTQHCDDCLVTALLHPEDGALEIAEELEPPLQTLSGAGLIPVLRFRPRAGSPEAGSAEGEDGPHATADDRPEAPPAVAG